MKVSPSRMFTSSTTGQILQEVLSGYKIGLAQLDHTFVHQQLAEAGMTDGEFANKVANMAGFYLVPYSGAVVMSQPIRALDYGVAYQSVEKSSQTLDNKPLLDFIPDERSDETQEDFQPEFTYFTANGGMQNYVPPDTPPERLVKISDYIYSPEYASFLADGMKVMTGMYQTATARLRGDASVRPGTILDINTGLTRAATDSFDGLWYVTLASTYIDEKVFQTGLQLCRDRYRAAKSGFYQQF